jgi:hypothetical protein
MKRVIIIGGILAALCVAGTASASFVITDIQQISPHVRAQLKGNRGRQGARGPQGPRGAQGPQGVQGTQGPAGPVTLGKLVRVAGPANSIAPFGLGSSTANCPAGDDIVSGGFITASARQEVFSNDSFGGNSWTALLDNSGSSVSGSVQAVAYCAPAGEAVAASVRYVSVATVSRRVHATEAQQRQVDHGRARR